MPGKLTSLGGVAFMIAVVGCETTQNGSSVKNLSPVEQGRKLYLGRCTACHAPEPVRDYTREEWSYIIPDMAKESNLDSTQTAALQAYIDSQL